MKAVITVTLVLIFISDIFAQNDSLRSETVLKIEKSHFRKSQLKRFKREGFDTDAYGWDDLYINTYLKKSTSRKTLSDITGMAGGLLIILNALDNFVGSTFDEQGDFEPSNQLYVIGGSMVGASIILSFDSRSKLKKAKVRFTKLNNQ